jgi:ABC-type transporter Mla MlaB component
VAVPEESRTASVRALRPPLGPGTIVLVIDGPIARADVPELCRRACELLEGSYAAGVVCDVGALVDPDAASVDALARLQLTVQRLGHQIRLLHACGELRELLDLMGLGDVVPLCAGLALEPSGEAEHREEPRGVEEEADPADPTG